MLRKLSLAVLATVIVGVSLGACYLAATYEVAGLIFVGLLVACIIWITYVLLEELTR